MTKFHRTPVFRSPLMRVAYASSLLRPLPSQRDDGTTVEKYSCTLILPITNVAGLELLEAKVAEVVKAQWREGGPDRFKTGLIKSPFLPGNGQEAMDQKTGELRAGLGPGVIFIRVSSGKKPGLYNKAVLPASEHEVKSGYWCYAALNAYAWHSAKHGDGVSFGIDMLQFVKEDEVLGGPRKVDPNTLFEKLANGTPINEASAMFD